MQKDLDTIRNEAIAASVAGFQFLLVYGLCWIVAAVLSFVLPLALAPWAYC